MKNWAKLGFGRDGREKYCKFARESVLGDRLYSKLLTQNHPINTLVGVRFQSFTLCAMLNMNNIDTLTVIGGNRDGKYIGSVQNRGYRKNKGRSNS